VGGATDHRSMGVPDPATLSGSDDEKLKHYIETSLVLKRRIELMLALSSEKLNELSLRDIGVQ
jgi:hypothetical protein